MKIQAMSPRRGVRRRSTGMLSIAMDCPGDGNNELLARLLALRASLAPHRPKAQLSPISQLPNEMLLAIFDFGLGPPAHCSSLPFELAVSSVCRAWRAVVLSSPELWTHVYITARTPINHMAVYSMRSAKLPLSVDFCHWPTPKRGREHLSTEVFLDPILVKVREFTHRLLRFSIWDVSDTAVLSILAGLVGVHAPLLRHVSAHGNPSVYSAYYAGRHHWFPFPFLTRNAPSMSHLEVTHLPIETFRSSMRLSASSLVSLTITASEDFSALPSSLPAYLIGFEDLILLLRSTSNLTYLALYGPVIEFDDDAFIESPSSRVRLAALRTLIIHCRECYLYHADLLSAITAPDLIRLEIPWHDGLEGELVHVDLTSYLFDDQGSPKFGSVRHLYLHDSAVKWRLPTRSFIRAFPMTKDVILGGNDVLKFVATLRGLVRRHEADTEVTRFSPEAWWSCVRRLTLRDFHLRSWKGCVRGLLIWLAAHRQHHRERMVVRVEGAVPSDRASWFLEHLEKLKRYAEIENAVFVSG
ncbi:hypothetical protein BS17DRAFT_132503 [Gyrodon lividus]|nr:hypothetical protein BS17DRAFT_132503 [Gyrodon lividus]